MIVVGRGEDGIERSINENHFTTHSLCVGMTGSGKTGFSISILEKLALLKIPALILDPKGDLCNLFLIFPDLKVEDFSPYSKEPERVSKIWKENLEKEGIKKEDILKLKDSVERKVVTPGISSVSPLNILPSLKAPTSFEIQNDIESVREKIRNTVSAIFKLFKKEPDPFSDPPFIFLSLCIEHFFKSGRDIGFEDLILSLENPPFSNLGVLPLEKVFPLNERREIAFKLNNLIASPNFSPWFTGYPLDFNFLFWTKEGKPCHTIVYLNHLEEELKQFAVTLILSELYNFIRKKRGTEDLKYLLYFDEIFGFLPPSPSNPPSKNPLLTLLKKSRAFGLGVFLATQNPIDLDYKALSNIGIYAIGRLHTQQDKDRIKDIIGRDEKEMEKISNLKQREFWLKDVKDPLTPYIVKSSQVISYLKGPMTLEELKVFAKGEEEKNLGEKRAYFIPSNIPVFYEKSDSNLSPYLFAEVSLFYSKESANFNFQRNLNLISEIKKEGEDWKVLDKKLNLNDELKYFNQINIPFDLDLERVVKEAERELKEKISLLCPIKLFYNSNLKIYSKPNEEKEAFTEYCSKKFEDILKEKLDEKKRVYGLKLERIREQIEIERQRLKKEEEELRLRSAEKNINILEAGLQILFGGKKLGSKLRRAASRVSQISTKERQVLKEKNDVEEKKRKISQLEEDIVALQKEMEKELEMIEGEFKEKIYEIEEVLFYPLKSKSHIEKIGVVFLDKNSLNF